MAFLARAAMVALPASHVVSTGGRMKPLNSGQKAPDFELPGALRERKTRFRLSDYLERGHVVLAFYPADFTPT